MFLFVTPFRIRQSSTYYLISWSSTEYFMTLYIYFSVDVVCYSQWGILLSTYYISNCQYNKIWSSPQNTHVHERSLSCKPDKTFPLNCLPKNLSGGTTWLWHIKLHSRWKKRCLRPACMFTHNVRLMSP